MCGVVCVLGSELIRQIEKKFRRRFFYYYCYERCRILITSADAGQRSGATIRRRRRRERERERIEVQQLLVTGERSAVGLAAVRQNT